MNFYSHHLGDYARNTRHLTMLEHGAYRLLIDLYYSREVPLPADEKSLSRLVCARTDEEKEAVATVLSEFFELTDDGWRHARCDEEIERCKDKQSKAKASASARWDANAMRTHSERNAKAMLPLANSHYPLANSQEKKEREDAREGGDSAGDDKPDAAGAASRSRSTSIPLEFPSEAELAWCESERPELAAGTVAVQFRDYHLAHGSTMKSWPAAWRTWVRKERPPPRAAPSTNTGHKTASEKQAEAIFRITGGLAGKPPTDEVIDVESFRPRQLAGR